MSNAFSPSIICVNGLPATAVWITSSHVGDADVPEGALLAVDRELQVRLPLDAEHRRRRGCPGTSARAASTRAAEPLQLVQVGADDLDRVLALDARRGPP